MLLEKLAGKVSKLSADDKKVLAQVRSAAAAEVDSDEKTRAQKFLKLIITELKEGREILEVKDCFDNDGKDKYSSVLFEVYHKDGNDKIPQLSKSKQSFTDAEKAIIKQRLAKLVGDYERSFAGGGGEYLLSYSENIPEDILGALKKLDNKDGHLATEKASLLGGIKDVVSDLFYDLYVALEKNSPGSGKQLFFVPEQNALDSQLVAFIAETYSSFDAYVRSSCKNSEFRLSGVLDDKNCNFCINVAMAGGKPSLTYGFDISHTRLRVDMDQMQMSQIGENFITPVTNNFPMNVHLRYKLNAKFNKVELLPESKCYVAHCKNGTQVVESDATGAQRTLRSLIQEK